MLCRYCKKFKSVTLASMNYPKGKYKTDRICPFKDAVVNRDDSIYEEVPVPNEDPKKKPTKFKKVYCEGFELSETFYCEQGYTISVEGCLRRQEDEEEPECRKCKRKYDILEMKKISFFMQRKREKASKRPKPIVR